MSGRATAAANELVIGGRLVDAPQRRCTPAGVPITRFVIEHDSEQMEAGHPRRVQCRLRVVAVGDPLAGRCAALQAGSLVRVSGFLARAGYRAPDMKTELHARTVESVTEAN